MPNSALPQQVEYLSCALPMSWLGILQLWFDDFECTRERDAQASFDAREHRLGLLAIGKFERRTLGKAIKDRPQSDRFIQFFESLNTSVQAYGDRQVPGLDDTRTTCLRIFLAALHEMVDLVIDELLIALDVGLIDMKARRRMKETLKSRDRLGARWGHLVGRKLRDHKHPWCLAEVFLKSQEDGDRKEAYDEFPSAWTMAVLEEAFRRA